MSLNHYSILVMLTTWTFTNKSATGSRIRGEIGSNTVLLSSDQTTDPMGACEYIHFLNSSVVLETNPDGTINPVPTQLAESNRGSIERLIREGKELHCETLRDITFYSDTHQDNAPDESNPGQFSDNGERQGNVKAPTLPTISMTTAQLISDDPFGVTPQTWSPPALVDSKQFGWPLSSPRGRFSLFGNDPVDLFSGSFTVEDVDLSIPNTLLPLQFIRTYRSGSTYLGAFGWCWDHNHNHFIRELADGSIARWNGRLHEDVFELDGSDYLPRPGIFEKLLKTGGGKYEVHATGGMIWTFERPDLWTDPYRIPVKEIHDRFGNKLKYDYDTQSRLLRVTCVPGDSEEGDAFHYLEFIYGNCGLLEHVQDSVGRSVHYDHDPDIQHLVRVRLPDTGDHPDGTQRLYHYDELHADPELVHNILRVEDSDGRVFVENEYDDDPSSWSFRHVLRQSYGGNEFVNRYTQIQAVPPLPDFILAPAIQVEVFAPDGGLTTYTFNYQGDLLDRRLRLNKDRSWRVVAWSYDYDNEGNLITIHEPDGRQERREYDIENSDPRMRGNLLRRTSIGLGLGSSRLVWEGTYESAYQLLTSETQDAGDSFTKNELKTVYEYGSIGKLSTITYPLATLPDDTDQTAQSTFVFNDRGQILSVTTPEGTENSFVYDNTGTVAKGRLLVMTNDVGLLGVEESYAYDSFGYLQSTTDGTGAVTQVVYNKVGQIERQILPAVDGVTADFRFHYDSDGKIIEVERPRGSYNDPILKGDYIIDRIRRNVLGYAERAEIGVNTVASRLISTIVDYRGLPKRTIDPAGMATIQSYDERGLLIEEQLQGKDGSRQKRRTVYDYAGRVSAVIEGVAEDVVKKYEYDSFGRLSRIHRMHRVLGQSDTPAGATFVALWNDRGLLRRVERRQYPGGASDTILFVEEYEYDQRGRKTKKISRPFTVTFDEVATPELVTKYFYDKDSRVVKVVDHRGGVRELEYDGLNRLVQTIDPLHNTRNYAYNLEDRTIITEVLDVEPGGGVVSRSSMMKYDSRGRLIQSIEAIEPGVSSLQIEYDDRDLPIAVVDQLGVRRERLFGLMGEMLSETFDPGGLGITNTWEYDASGLLRRYTDPTNETTVYQYDGIGRPIVTLLPGGARHIMAYGADGRLQRTTLASGARIDYAYDESGRLASVEGHGVTGVSSVDRHSFTYDLLDRITNAAAGSVSVSRAYDSLGRLLTETTHDVQLEMTYDDATGTLVRTWPDGREETLTLDLNGIVTKIERTATGSLGSGSALLAEIGLSGPASPANIKRLNSTVECAFEYDVRKRVRLVEHTDGATPLERGIYRYDASNRRRVELLDIGTVQRRLHAFDTRRRLTTTTEGFGAPTLLTTPTAYTQAENDTDIQTVESTVGTATPIYDFSYNLADARTRYKETGALDRDYSYQPGHRLDAAGPEAFGYHADGVEANSGSNSYTIDAFGRVLQIHDAATNALRNELAYDPFGRVASITDAVSVTRDLCYFGNEIWQENEGSTAVRQLTQHPMMPNPLAIHTSGATYLPLYDARINLLALADDTGAIVHRYRYEAFGGPSASTSPTTTGIEPYFGGMRYLKDAGVYMAGMRLMDPRHGTWLSLDPAGYTDSPDLYAYVGQNPIDYTDPNGTSSNKGTPSLNSDGSTLPWWVNPMSASSGIGGRGNTAFDLTSPSLLDHHSNALFAAPGLMLGMEGGTAVGVGAAGSGISIGGLTGAIPGVGLGTVGVSSIFYANATATEQAYQDYLHSPYRVLDQTWGPGGETPAVPSALPAELPAIRPIDLPSLALNPSSGAIAAPPITPENLPPLPIPLPDAHALRRAAAIAKIVDLLSRAPSPQVSSVYSLRAGHEGWYPVVATGAPVSSVYLEKDETWKYGKSNDPRGRYETAFLTTLDLRMDVLYTGTEPDALAVEKMFILGYIVSPKNLFRSPAWGGFLFLPPGNRIYR